MDIPRDYYADLELPPTADAETIKSKFKKLALQVHPDRNLGIKAANQWFCRIKEAYDILSDPEEKAKYDASRRRRRYQGPSRPEDNPWSNVTPQQPSQARARATPWRAEDQRFSAGVPNSKQYTKSKAEAAQPRNGASATTTGGKRPTPHPPPPPTESANQRKEASFGSRRNGFHPRTTHKPPATSSNYTSRPPPVPQGPTSTATTDPPVPEGPQAINKNKTPAPTSTPPPRPREFPFPQPAQNKSSPDPVEPPKQSQQPAEFKQSSGTIPMPSAPQDTNAKPASPEWQSGNAGTPNGNEKKPVNPKTPFNLDKEGSGGGREFHKFPTPPTAPQIPALINGVQPSEIDKETYLEDFKNYLNQWNLFKIQIIGHYCARKATITNQQNSGSGDIQEYYEWLLQDDDVRRLFIAAGEEHKTRFTELMMLFQM
ncbi:DnAJ-like protein [Fusarium oxysporum f. sp. rapae]|uniref:DnAJ-like protein n=1 Tax=Fusarium oxysporum f. sp. rapae TaxID=485398 RepID=A0A8J5NJU9_FUSOX|nr:DnAJ-like protein [Fusarium oxysporum f. sp. rapae]